MPELKATWKVAEGRFDDAVTLLKEHGGQTSKDLQRMANRIELSGPHETIETIREAARKQGLGELKIIE